MDHVTWLQVVKELGVPAAFALAMLWLLVKNDEKLQRELKEHRSERQREFDEHRKERGEWKTSQDTLHRETNQALKDLTRVISELGRK